MKKAFEADKNGEEFIWEHTFRTQPAKFYLTLHTIIFNYLLY
jgi:hypothetical protein